MIKNFIELFNRKGTIELMFNYSNNKYRKEKSKLIKLIKINNSYLDESLIDFYSKYNPINFEIEWIPEYLNIYSVEKLADNQKHFYHPFDNDWNKNNIVIGDGTGDPIIYNRKTKKVYTSIHGGGEWKLILIAENLDEFFLFLLIWIKSINKFKKNIVGNNFNYKKDFLEYFKSELIKNNISTKKFNNFLKLQ